VSLGLKAFSETVTILLHNSLCTKYSKHVTLPDQAHPSMGLCVHMQCTQAWSSMPAQTSAACPHPLATCTRPLMQGTHMLVCRTQVCMCLRVSSVRQRVHKKYTRQGDGCLKYETYSNYNRVCTSISRHCKSASLLISITRHCKSA